MHLPFPNPQGDETIVELALFENFVGAANLCILSQTFVDFPKVKDFMLLFPDGITNSDDYSQLTEPTSIKKAQGKSVDVSKHPHISSGCFTFTALYNKGRKVLNLHYAKSKVFGELKGNCGVYRNSFEYYDSICNFLPFLQISCIN